ncbi:MULTISPECIES: hypothetical protein [Micromonospora]|uniref:Uncharacterized protein n=1 Tax=Micromonospora solifontis TaxID=2487138 RepID=A0ABX9WEL9_9ACTN|nr:MULTISPECIES: hypothetical protein [Micromonospora]NES16287.1 hypothetical protein [Micromonospora sp. PPF5-17B]NES38347.1 hypothetical protein [Micromonospora solifontis]NES58099.1 hypothetical protein [Micromonospora sp. PPF5-6]RNL95879.1 hypothetical protein EFE23_19665 [Micromonospora solifontis]
MSADEPSTGGFTGDPAAALQITGSGDCCGSPAQAVGDIRPPAGRADGDEPCCGTREAARAADSCCGTRARADAVATGQGCCS